MAQHYTLSADSEELRRASTQLCNLAHFFATKGPELEGTPPEISDKQWSGQLAPRCALR